MLIATPDASPSVSTHWIAWRFGFRWTNSTKCLLFTATFKQQIYQNDCLPFTFCAYDARQVSKSEFEGRAYRNYTHEQLLDVSYWECMLIRADRAINYKSNKRSSAFDKVSWEDLMCPYNAYIRHLNE